MLGNTVLDLQVSLHTTVVSLVEEIISCNTVSPSAYKSDPVLIYSVNTVTDLHAVHGVVFVGLPLGHQRTRGSRDGDSAAHHPPDGGTLLRGVPQRRTSAGSGETRSSFMLSPEL